MRRLPSAVVAQLRDANYTDAASAHLERRLAPALAESAELRRLAYAVVHRDYALAGEAVRVFCYADRIEVRSPSMLPFGVTVEDMVQLRVQSRPRNPIIA